MNMGNREDGSPASGRCVYSNSAFKINDLRRIVVGFQLLAYVKKDRQAELDAAKIFTAIEGQQARWEDLNTCKEDILSLILQNQLEGMKSFIRELRKSAYAEMETGARLEAARISRAVAIGIVSWENLNLQDEKELWELIRLNKISGIKLQIKRVEAGCYRHPDNLRNIFKKIRQAVELGLATQEELIA